MSDRGVVALLLALAGAPGPVEAQAGDTIHLSGPALVAAVAELREAREVLRRETDTKLAAAGASTGALDTVRAGSIAIVVPPGYRARAEVAARRTAALFRPFAGANGEIAALAGHPFVPPAAAWTGARAAEPGRRIWTAEDLAGWIGQQVPLVLWQRMDEPLRYWVGSIGDVRDVRDVSAAPPPAALGLEAAYVELITWPDSAFRACQGGDLAACGEALWTIPGPGDRAPGRGRVPAPQEARTSLLGTALRLGGPGAFDRLLDTPELPIEARFAAAARVAPDSLIAVWRADVLAARPVHTGATPRLAGVALGWTILFGIAAARSTKWR